MTIESVSLLSNITAESADLSVFTYSEKQKGAGYSRRSDATHTIHFQLNEFKGTVKIQGTLALYPGDRDWVDLEYDSGSSLESVDSSSLTSDEMRNITGNWVWIRCAYVLEQGTITSIRYNF